MNSQFIIIVVVVVIVYNAAMNMGVQNLILTNIISFQSITLYGYIHTIYTKSRVEVQKVSEKDDLIHYFFPVAYLISSLS